MAQVARAQTEAAGGPEKLRSLSVQFRGMGFPEEELTVTATVKAVEGETAVIETEAEQDGRRIIRKGQAELRLG